MALNTAALYPISEFSSRLRFFAIRVPSELFSVITKVKTNAAFKSVFFYVKLLCLAKISTSTVDPSDLKYYKGEKNHFEIL